jgi:hypothetical protein
VHALAPHSLASEKARQRDRLLDMIERLLRTRPRVNVYVFDDWLLRPADCPPPPSTPATAGSGTLVAAEILTRFGADRVTVWAPNLKPAVVAALRELSQATTPPGRNQPCVMTGVGCYCAFNRRWREHLYAMGGLDVLSADCFGAFSTGVTQLVRDLSRYRLFYLHRDVHNSEPAALVAWAVSDLPERMRGWKPEPGQEQESQPKRRSGMTPAEYVVCPDTFGSPCCIAYHPQAQMLVAFADIFDGTSTHLYRPQSQKSYSRTMHYVEVELLQREYVAPGPDGFAGSVVYKEQ